MFTINVQQYLSDFLIISMLKQNAFHMTWWKAFC